jgi:predicted  nucleic acid-binding Zn-ribbon protein
MDSATRNRLAAVNPNLDIKDYVDVKVEAEIGKNINVISTKFDELRNDFRVQLEKTNEKIDKANEKTNEKIDKANEKIEKINEKLENKIDKLDAEFKTVVADFKGIKLTGTILSSLFALLVTTNIATFVKDVFFK